MIDTAREIAQLRALLAEREAELASARAELTGAKLLIEQYKAQLAKLRRMQFGQSSEKLDAQIHQLELMLEDLEEGEATRTAPSLPPAADAPGRRPRDRRQPVRRPLPDHLPREEIVHSPGEVCPGCGGTHFSKLGEDVTEVLEKIPARLKVIRHVRPKLSCRSCETIIQAPSPDLPIEKGRPGSGLIANVVVGKYLDGLPLYRQSAILAREGIETERATLADWVGHAAWWVAPLAELIGAHVMAAPVIHAAVIELGYTFAQLIIEHAESGERPEPSTAHPEAFPVPARDEVMLAEDRSGWSMINGRRFSYVLRSEETVREMEIVEPKPTKRRHKAVEQRLKAVRVEFCPVDWFPTPAYVDMVNAIYDRWLDAMCELLLSLEGAKLKNHLLTGFSFERGPSFDVPDYGPARQEQRAQLIRMDDTVGDLRAVDGANQVVTMRRHVRVVLERPAA